MSIAVLSVQPQAASRMLIDGFRERCACAPQAPALAFSGQAMSYGELQELVCGFARRLSRLDLGERAPVAVVGPKSPSTVALVLACLMTARPVLLAPADLRFDALHELLEHAGVEHVLGAHAVAGAVVVEPAEADESFPASHPPPSAQDVALMLTTSGSTGFPKVVPISHGAIGRFAHWAGARFEIEPGAVVLSYCALSFDLSILELWTTLAHGGCAVLVGHERATHGAHLLELVKAHAVTLIQGVPMLYELLLEAATATDTPVIAHSVRHLLLTGDFTPEECLRRLPRVFERARIYNVYGCTETNDSFLFELPAGQRSASAGLPLGHALPGVSALIVADSGCVLAGPGRGELWVSTPFQTRGYLGPRSSSASFELDPRGCTQRTYFRSGDVVRRDGNGETVLEGRVDRQVKVAGVRVDLRVVEHVLLSAPEVREAAVLALEQPLVGKRLHALVRAHESAVLDTLALRRRCARRLTRAAIPSIIEVREQPLPRTSTGKLDRGALRRSLES